MHEQISAIEKRAKNMASEYDQIIVSNEIKNVAQNSSHLMNSEDVKKTSNIIENLITFKEEHDTKDLNEEVRNNILKTIDNIHKSTTAKEMARDNVATDMRSSMEKLQVLGSSSLARPVWMADSCDQLMRHVDLSYTVFAILNCTSGYFPLNITPYLRA